MRQVAAGTAFTVAMTADGRVFQMGETGATCGKAAWEGALSPQLVGARLAAIVIAYHCSRCFPAVPRSRRAFSWLPSQGPTHTPPCRLSTMFPSQSYRRHLVHLARLAGWWSTELVHCGAAFRWQPPHLRARGACQAALTSAGYPSAGPDCSRHVTSITICCPILWQCSRTVLALINNLKKIHWQYHPALRFQNA